MVFVASKNIPPGIAYFPPLSRMAPFSQSIVLMLDPSASSDLFVAASASSCASSHRKLLFRKAHRLARNSASLQFGKKTFCKGAGVVCGLGDFVGGDLLGFDLGKWSADVEKHGSIAVYAPPEGGYEGRYATRLMSEGYHFLNLTARGLGDLEACLTKVHAVRPPHLGKQPVAVWHFPPTIDYRLSLLPKNSKGLVLWLIEAQVLSKSELKYLALLPNLRPNLRIIAECGSWRKFTWKPLNEVAELPL